jgi:hypothetical protein
MREPCPLYSQKQTYAVQNGMSALPPKADISVSIGLQSRPRRLALTGQTAGVPAVMEFPQRAQVSERVFSTLPF